MKKMLEKIKKLPKKPGLYFFKDKKDQIIYIGKSVNLKNRVKSYFQNRNLGTLTNKMIALIKDVEIKVCSSEFEALLLEAKLINQYQPFFNIQYRDGKSFLMIGVSKEDFPRVFSVRQKELTGWYFGPFPSGAEVRKVLMFLRRVFPFRSCQRLPNKPCLYYHLKLCPGCCMGMVKTEYKKTIDKIRKFLNGNTRNLLAQLKKEMKDLAKGEKFEEAAVVKKQIDNIYYTVQNWQSLDETSLSIILPRDRQEKIFQSARKILPQLEKLKKIEAYDISNLYGKQASGSMVSFENLIPAKDQYRRFKIRISGRLDDLGMMQEVVKRRLRHKEWIFPDLVIIDGGKSQVGAVWAVLREMELDQKILVLGLTKPAKTRKEEIIIKPIIKDKTIIKWQKIRLLKDNPFLRLIQELRNESHRFAKNYHLWLRRKSFH